MPERKLIVEVVGDASSYTKALNQATQSTKAFGRQMNAATGAAGRPLDPLLANVRRLRAQADDLQESSRRAGEGAAAAAPGFRQLAGTAGLFGVATAVAFSASRHLSEALKTTGNAAFTTEGRIKNLGAALASGDIIGGIQALVVQESRLAPDLEKAVALLHQMRDEASRISLKDVVGDTDKFHGAAAQATKDMVSIGIPIDDAKDKTAAWVTELQRAAGVTVDLGGMFETIFGRISALLDETTKKAIAARKQGLARLSEVPPGISAAITREAGPTGSEAGRLKVLEQADANLLRRIEETRKQGSGRDVSEALERLQSERNSVNAQIESILKQQDQRRLDALAEAERRRKAAADRLAEAIRAQREAFATVLGLLEIRLDRARATSGFRDDLRLLAEQEATVRAQIAVEGRTVELERRLLTIEQQRATIAQQRKETAQRQRQADQFRSLGLTAEGDDLTPTIANLQKQLKSLTERVAGTDLDTPKTKGLLARIRKVLMDPLDKATVESRAKIKALFDTIRSGFEEGTGPLTKTSGLNTKKILEGLGLDAATEAEIRSRLSGFNSAGRALAPKGATATTGGVGPIGIGGAIVVESHTTLVLDGDVVARSITRSQQKARRRNPKQKRGPNRTGGV